MASAGANEKVIIIGAGVAGLVLAQILRQGNIPYEIYDRDDGSHWQGWAVGLDKSVSAEQRLPLPSSDQTHRCLDVLYPLLPKDLQDPLECSPSARSGRLDSLWILNGQTHESLGVLGNVSKGQFGHMIHANRAALRNILMQHAGLQMNKTFEKYEEKDECVTVFFTDGTSTQGALLVGADGASSKVRLQLLNGFKSTPSRYTAIQGESVLSKELTSKVLGESNSGVLVADRDQKANCLVMDFNGDGTTVFCWILAYKVKEYGQEQSWARAATAEELYQKAKVRTDHWPDFLKAVVKETGPRGIHRPPIRLLETVLPEDTLPNGRVTLLGDAMHSMVSPATFRWARD